ncbi:MAG TPA: tyrosine--tRNA ligase, partial [Candidatus Hydrogenedentes bacterium]|nr:tyrosine--tRNA ligase [Candidatus Hydrogenedentota bacterium]
EFSYSLLQAYDFLHLCGQHDCRLQIGGSDQWGNIVAGMDLTRRLLRKDTYGLTFPLITKADGTKFGKTESGSVWLDPGRTSPYRFYQFWINQADADTPRLIRFFTFLDHEAIAELDRAVAEEPHKRAAQRRLAEETTRMVHGAAALANAVKASDALFGGDLRGLDQATLEDVFSEAPSATLPRAALGGDRLLLDALVEAGVFSSKGEVRRLVKNGGLYLNNERIDAEDAKLTPAACLAGDIAVVRTGKRNYHLLRFTA